MADLEAFASQLDQLRGEIEQSHAQGQANPEALERLKGVAEQMKTAVTSSMAALHSEMSALAKKLRQQAAAIEQEKKDAADKKPVEVPHPWEDHQGLEDDAVEPLVASLMKLVKQGEVQGTHNNSVGREDREW